MKLIKDEIGYFLWDSDVIASTEYNLVITLDLQKLSKQNCDEIFGIVDVEKLAEETMGELFFEVKALHKELFKKGFNKAMELNKDKLFTVEDIMKAFEAGYETLESEKTYNEHYDILIQSLQQPTEIEVEIEMICPHPSDTYKCELEFGCDEDGCNNPNQILYLDKNGCLILTKKKQLWKK